MKKMFYLFIIVSILTLAGCQTSTKGQKEDCLADEECFRESLLTCSKAKYSKCDALGTCQEASIEGEENDRCIVRNWESRDSEVINYDVTCDAPKKVKFVDSHYLDDREKGKYLSPAYICERPK